MDSNALRFAIKHTVAAALVVGGLVVLPIAVYIVLLKKTQGM